jgi:hypothetical protein
MMPRQWNRPALAGAVLVTALVVGCDHPAPTAADGTGSGRSIGAASEPFIPVPVSAIRSGMPERADGVIDLSDETVWIDILDVESHLPRSASATSLRIGPSWAAGTAAERFQILDLDGDSRRDIRLWFSLPRLAADGHVTPATTAIVLWGHDTRSGLLYRAEAAVTVVPPPVAAGAVIGRVVDGTGAPVTGAGASLIGVAQGTTTDADGRFEIEGVLPGTYHLEVWRAGFLGRVLGGVEVEEGGVTDVGTITIVAVTADPWAFSANGLRGRNGERFVHLCPAGGSQRAIWGTDLYTDDSPVCVAAVHVGAIGFAAGGRVTFEVRPGSSGYVGTLRNGVQSLNWSGSWGGSYVIAPAP